MITLEDIKKTYMGRSPKPIGKHRFFSVLVPFVEKDGEINILFEVRARDMESQPGEICFPGGNVEINETYKNCALRETYEEIGISQDKISIIGQGNILFGYANYTLFSYIGVISYEDVLKAKLAEEEVDEIFLVPLEKFMTINPLSFENKIYTQIHDDDLYKKVGIDENYPWRVGKWTIPVYDIDGRIIWGLTARILENIIETINGK